MYFRTHTNLDASFDADPSTSKPIVGIQFEVTFFGRFSELLGIQSFHTEYIMARKQ